MSNQALAVRGKASVELIKGTSEDKEFYPSTTSIINAVKSDILTICGGSLNGVSILDIGAGDGRVLEGIAKEEIVSGYTDQTAEFRHNPYSTSYVAPKVKLMGIEQSPSLVSIWHNSIIPVGTDFFKANLMDISADLSYCNPPFSVFNVWITKVITESMSKSVYFTAPVRWSKSVEINNAIRLRQANTTSLGFFSFADGDRPVRKERADVEVFRIDFNSANSDGSNNYVNPMSLWLQETFGDAYVKEKAVEKTVSERVQEHNSKVTINNAPVVGDDYIASLISLYNIERDTIINAIEAFSKIDASVLATLNLDINDAFRTMRTNLAVLRCDYWRELFKNIKDLNQRFPSKVIYSFSKLLDKQTTADFTNSNIRAVLIWILKNADSFGDELLESTVNSLMMSCNISLYKSNRSRFTLGEWEYANRRPESLSHIKLNTTKRIIATEYMWTKNKEFLSSDGRITATVKDLINDLLVLATNRGFKTDDFDLIKTDWQSGKPKLFKYTEALTGKTLTLMQVKVFKSGTVHFNFDSKFINQINVEFGKRKGWITTPREAADELEIDINEALIAFNQSNSFTSINNTALLLN
ncbi:DUF4942 domain-containing protein [Vibrio splendidus]|nr:DUF4942 domain-containing protein [Vibrio splendidus]MCC4883067.1 DUF4942 domain-containing protein [Vibrio splendidus]